MTELSSELISVVGWSFLQLCILLLAGLFSSTGCCSAEDGSSTGPGCPETGGRSSSRPLIGVGAAVACPDPPGRLMEPVMVGPDPPGRLMKPVVALVYAPHCHFWPVDGRQAQTGTWRHNLGHNVPTQCSGDIVYHSDLD